MKQLLSKQGEAVLLYPLPVSGVVLMQRNIHTASDSIVVEVLFQSLSFSGP